MNQESNNLGSEKKSILKLVGVIAALVIVVAVGAYFVLISVKDTEKKESNNTVLSQDNENTNENANDNGSIGADASLNSNSDSANQSSSIDVDNETAELDKIANSVDGDADFGDTTLNDQEVGL